MTSLRGKWALVTGSTRGIGQQIAIGLARLGCNLVVHGRSAGGAGRTLELLEPSAVETVVVAGDFGRDSGVTSVIEGVLAGPGHVDILYNNAAIMNTWQPIGEISPTVWRDAFQVNVVAPIGLCSAFVPGMRSRGYGRIINLTSGIKDTPNLSPYSISKAALDKYTLDLAAELRGTNVLANTLDPGWLRTDMGGPHADHDVVTVLPGALVPALLADHGDMGKCFAAQDYRSGPAA